tara:strand:+ start:155 stop:1198 length:1044 start_codon:yes stop_codon:yes gene_type:complete
MNINLISPVNELGYGVVGLNILKELSKEHKVALFPLGNVGISDEDVKKAVDNTSTYDVNAPSLRIYHQFDMAMHVGKGMHAGFPIFELNKFDDREKHHLKSMDKLFVCSSWAKKIIRENEVGVETVVAPFGVDREMFNENGVSSSDKTIFLNIGKWEVRKGHDILLEAFSRAFTDENVELWMLCNNPFLSEQDNMNWETKYRIKLGNKVKIINRLGNHRDVASLMKKVDCGVFPSRAEGWNLELLEMMSCGKHVIATDYSGHTEFANKDNCYLIDVKELEKARDGIWFNGQGDWAKLGNEQVEQLVNHMRRVHELKENGKLSVNEEGINTAKKFSWENGVRKIIDSF